MVVYEEMNLPVSTSIYYYPDMRNHYHHGWSIYHKDAWYFMMVMTLSGCPRWLQSGQWYLLRGRGDVQAADRSIPEPRGHLWRQTRGELGAGDGSGIREGWGPGGWGAEGFLRLVLFMALILCCSVDLVISLAFCRAESCSRPYEVRFVRCITDHIKLFMPLFGFLLCIEFIQDFSGNISCSEIALKGFSGCARNDWCRWAVPQWRGSTNASRRKRSTSQGEALVFQRCCGGGASKISGTCPTYGLEFLNSKAIDNKYLCYKENMYLCFR